MSKGIVHVQASVILAGAFAIMSEPEYAIGALLGTILSPDLDVDKAFIGDKIVRKTFQRKSWGKWGILTGTIAHGLWRQCWHFYRKSIKHGSELSHFPVISTLGRIAYLFLFCVIIPSLVLSWFGFDFLYEVQWYFGILCRFWKVVVGLMGSDFIHYVLDIATVNDSFNVNSLLGAKTRGRR